MNFSYEQAKDNRWTASAPPGSVAQTTVGAMQFATGQVKPLPTVTSDGACHGISMWWLIKRSLGDNFWDWFGPPAAAAPGSQASNGKAGEPVECIKEVMHLQKAFLANPGKNRAANHMAAVNYILKRATPHLVRRRNLVLRRNATFATLAAEITVAKGYVLAGYWRQNWGGHAVAAHILNDASVEFMDPNIGEIEFADFRSFYAWAKGACATHYNFSSLNEAEIQTLERP